MKMKMNFKIDNPKANGLKTKENWFVIARLNTEK